MKKIFTFSLALIAALSVNAQTKTTVTFEAAELAEDGTLQGTSYTENGYVFDNYNDPSQFYNSGYTVSNNTDRNNGSFMNQYSVDARGGADGSKNFLVYNPCYYGDCYIHRSDNADFTPSSVDLALTTYTSISTQDGDAYSKKFGKDDFYTMTVTGLDANGNVLNTIDIKLINYPMLWMPWATADLSELGKVNKLFISFSSSDSSEWAGVVYMNTPAYIALDNFTAEVDIADVIENASKPATANNAIHTIGGIRVQTAQRPGLYIMNGKKVFMK